MGKANDERLQRYFDGEMPPEERAQVEAALTDDDRLKLAALGEVRGLVANALLAEAAEIDLLPGIEAALRGGAHRRRQGRSQGAPSLGPDGASGPLVERLRGGGGGRFAPGVPTVAFCACAEWMRHREPRHLRRGVTVFRMNDSPHKADESTTVIFTEEDD